MVDVAGELGTGGAEGGLEAGGVEEGVGLAADGTLLLDEEPLEDAGGVEEVSAVEGQLLLALLHAGEADRALHCLFALQLLHALHPQLHPLRVHHVPVAVALLAVLRFAARHQPLYLPAAFTAFAVHFFLLAALFQNSAERPLPGPDVLHLSSPLQLLLQPALQSAFVVLSGFADRGLYYFLIVALALAVRTVQS